MAVTPPPPTIRINQTTRAPITRNTLAAAQRARATRQEHDSDDDNTEDEAEYQMDPNDGFWNPSVDEENMLRLIRTQELSNPCIREYTAANRNEVAGSDARKVRAALRKRNHAKLSACACCNKDQGGLSAHTSKALKNPL